MATSEEAGALEAERGARNGTLRNAHPIVKELLSGGTAGACAKTAVAPLERVKIIIQTSGVSHSGRPMEPASIGRVLRSIVHSEGMRGLWKGNGASVLRVVPYAALHFSAYERYRSWLLGLGYLGKTPVVDLVAGSAAGATAVAFTYPLDLLRTRLAWRTSAVVASSSGGRHHHHRATMASVLAQLARKEGIPGLYKGVSPTLLGIFPYAGLKFFVYQYLKGVYMEGGRAKEGTTGEEKVEGERFVSTPMKLVFGASAGLVAQTITYPLDVVRRRMQVQDLASGDPSGKIRSSLQGLGLIYRTLGVRKGLYAGLSLNYLKVVPSTAIGFAVYDTAKEYLGHRTSI